MHYFQIFLRAVIVIGVSFGFGALCVYASSTAPALITGVQAVNIIGSGAQITWMTDDLSDSQVYYGTSTANFAYTATSRCDGGGMVTSHCVNLTGLSSGMTYYYKVRSINQSGFAAEQEGYFTSALGTTGGTIPAAPSSLRLSSVSMSSGISLLWNDNSTNEDKFNIERKLSTESVYSGIFLVQLGVNSASYVDTTAISGVNYDYRIEACLSGYGCSAYAYLTGVSLLPLSDTIPPTAPSLSGTPYLSSQVNLSFPGATDNVGVVGYKIFRNGTYLTTVTTTIYSDMGLMPGTSYTYYVKAADAASNESAPSVTVSVLTGSDTSTNVATSTDTSAPSAPSSVSATAFSGTRVDLVWSGATDNIGVVGYKIFRNGAILASVTSNDTSYSDMSVSASTSYVYSIKSVDAAANVSALSMNTYVTTPTVTTVTTTTTTMNTDTSAPLVTSLRAINMMSSGAQITWVTDDLSDSRVVYGLIPNSSGSYPNSATSRCDSGGLVTNHCVNLTGLSPGTHYYYRVLSRNGFGLDVLSTESSFDTLRENFSTTTATTVTTTTTQEPLSASSSMLVGVTVERGLAYCEGALARTPITFTATPSSGASFYITTDTGNRKGDTLPGTYLLTNGTYYWRAIPHSGYMLSSGWSDSFVLNKICATAAITTNIATTTTTIEQLPQPLVNKTTLATTSTITSRPVVTPPSPLPPVAKPVDALPGSTTSSLSPIFSLFTQSPGVSTIATPEQYAHYCDDPAHQKECLLYTNKQIIITETPRPIVPLVTPEVFAKMESHGALPGDATNPEELKEVCAQSVYVSSCAELLVATHVLSKEEAKSTVDQQIAVRKEEAYILTARVGARIYQDTDTDGITDYDEINIYHTDPKKSDSNSDGVLDGEHLLSGTDPLLIVPTPPTHVDTPVAATTSHASTESVVLKKIIYEDPKFSGETKPELLTVTHIAAVSASTGVEDATSTKLALSGLALPNSFVTLFIFSDPIVVTVKTDESGAWTYVLDKELPDGTHQVMSALTDGGGHILAKSAPLPFIKEAAAVSISSPLLVSTPEAPGFFSGGSLYALIATLVGVFTLALILIGFVVRRRPSEQTSVPVNSAKDENNFFP